MKNNYLRLVMMLLLAVFTNAMQSRDFYAVNEDGDSVWYNDVVKTSVCHFYEVYQYYYNGDIVSDTAWYDNLSETKDGITSIVVLYSDGDTLWAGTMSDLKESTTSDDLFALDADEDTLWYNAAGKEFYIRSMQYMKRMGRVIPLGTRMRPMQTKILYQNFLQ